MKKTSDYGFAEIVGAYAIRPVHHRMNRIAKHRHDIAKPHTSGVCNTPLQRRKLLINCCLYIYGVCGTRHCGGWFPDLPKNTGYCNEICRASTLSHMKTEAEGLNCCGSSVVKYSHLPPLVHCAAMSVWRER